MQDLSYKEIAEMLEKNEDAIRKNLSRALSHFAQLYKKFYPDDHEF